MGLWGFLQNLIHTNISVCFSIKTKILERNNFLDWQINTYSSKRRALWWASVIIKRKPCVKSQNEYCYLIHILDTPSTSPSAQPNFLFLLSQILIPNQCCTTNCILASASSEHNLQKLISGVVPGAGYKMSFLSWLCMTQPALRTSSTSSGPRWKFSC